MNRLEKTITILVNAFLNETLEKGRCTKCAIGNIIAYQMGYNNNDCLWIKDRKIIKPEWYPITWSIFHNKKAIEQIESTGYSLDMVIKIEEAFESNTRIEWIDYDLYSRKDIIEDQFKGLMAVVDVLCEYEEQEADNYKQAFIEAKEVLI